MKYEKWKISSKIFLDIILTFDCFAHFFKGCNFSYHSFFLSFKSSKSAFYNLQVMKTRFFFLSPYLQGYFDQLRHQKSLKCYVICLTLSWTPTAVEQNFPFVTKKHDLSIRTVCNEKFGKIHFLLIESSKPTKSFYPCSSFHCTHS